MTTVMASSSLSLVACGNVESAERNERETSKAKDKKDKDKDKDKDKTKVSDSEYTKSVMMIYIVGSNLESYGSMATMDIEEMIGSGYDEELMDIYLCTGGASAWHTKEISADEIAIWKIEDGELNKLDTINTSTMGSPNTLKTFINKAYEDTDGDCYNLVLWNHGGGAIIGYGADETANYQAMTMSEVETAIGGSNLILAGKRFEIIGFDACLMGMLEVAAGLDDYANYLIASEELEPGEGWDYSCFGEITSGGDFTGPTVGKIIIDTFSNFYKNKGKYKPEFSLACMDLSKTGSVIESFELLVADGIDDLNNGDYSQIAKARSDTKVLGRVGGGSIYDSVDLYNLSENLGERYPDSTKAVQDSIDEFVVYYKSNIQRTHGVAVYMPYDNKEYVEKWLEIYDELEFSDDYEIFLDGYVATLTGESLADWNVSDVVAQQNPNVKSEYSIQLSPQQQATYAKSRVTVWEKDDYDHDLYVCRMASNDVELQDDGLLVANYDDKIFYLSNGAGEEISFTVYEVDRNTDYVLYTGTILVENFEDLDNWKYEFAEINIRVDSNNPNGEIISINELNTATDTNLFPQATPYQFEDGDTVSGYLYTKMAAFNSDGSVASFDKWTSPYASTTDGIAYDGDWSCDFRVNDELEEGSYFCLFSIKDTQGNVYETGAFVAEARVTDGAYLIDKPDTTLSPDSTYSTSTGKATVYDGYGEQVLVFEIPDNYDVYDKTTYSRAITLKEKNANGKYINDLVIDTSVSKILKDYIDEGIAPDSSLYPNFYCDVIDKKANNTPIKILTYDMSMYSAYDRKSVFVPYINCYGDSCYLSIDYEGFSEMSDSEIVAYVEKLLP